MSSDCPISIFDSDSGSDFDNSVRNAHDLEFNKQVESDTSSDSEDGNASDGEESDASVDLLALFDQPPAQLPDQLPAQLPDQLPDQLPAQLMTAPAFVRQHITLHMLSSPTTLAATLQARVSRGGLSTPVDIIEAISHLTIMNVASISDAARFIIARSASSEKPLSHFRLLVIRSMKHGTVFVGHYFRRHISDVTKEVVTRDNTPTLGLPPRPRNPSSSSSPSDFTFAGPLGVVRRREQTSRFLESEYCEANRKPVKRTKRNPVLFYTDGVDALFCHGHTDRKSTKVFLTGCGCTLKKPHCLQCMTTGIDIDAKIGKKCYNCNTPFLGFQFRNMCS
jgi:hypothetical protein